MFTWATVFFLSCHFTPSFIFTYIQEYAMKFMFSLRYTRLNNNSMQVASGLLFMHHAMS